MNGEIDPPKRICEMPDTVWREISAYGRCEMFAALWCGERFIVLKHFVLNHNLMGCGAREHRRDGSDGQRLCVPHRNRPQSRSAQQALLSL